MKTEKLYNKFKTIVSESRDVLLAVSISAGILFSGYMWYLNHEHQAELLKIQNENEIAQEKADDIFAMVLSYKFIGKLDSIIDRKVSKQLDTLEQMQEKTFDQAAEFYYISALRYDTLKVNQDLQNKQGIDLQIQIFDIRRKLAVIQGDTEYLKSSAYTDSLKTELNRLLSEKDAQRILKDMEYYHKQEIEQIKKKYDPEYPAKIKRSTRRNFQMKTRKRVFDSPL